jgi:very-short-patch-repair endonuclease
MAVETVANSSCKKTTPPVGHPSAGGELITEKELTTKSEVKNSPPAEGCPQGGVVEASSLEKQNEVMSEYRNTQNYFVLPYNPKLSKRARELRKAGNLSEVLFWNQVKNRQFKMLDFDRQKIIGNYIVDFYCASYNVVIEIDGNSHDEKEKYDIARDKYLKSLGLEVIHIGDIDVKKGLSEVMYMLHNHSAFSASITTTLPCNKTTPPCGHPSAGGELSTKEELTTKPEVKNSPLLDGQVVNEQGKNSPPAEGCPQGGVVETYRQNRVVKTTKIIKIIGEKY